MNKLKQHRVKAGMTQQEVADLVGVAQPTYQRWEARDAEINKTNQKKLAKVFGVTVEALLGPDKPVEIGFYDPDAQPHLSYWGEVSLHFRDGGAPLLLSISDAASARLNRDAQLDIPFLVIQSLSNQTVIVRRSAIADMYLATEAYDHYGPKDEDYSQSETFQHADERDWAILETLSIGFGSDDFDDADVARVRQMVELPEDYRSLREKEGASAEQIDRDYAEIDDRAEKIFKMATDVVYQLSGGKKRDFYADERDELFEGLRDFLENPEMAEEYGMTRISTDGGHRVIHINNDAFDYISAPSHQITEGRLEYSASLLDD